MSPPLVLLHGWGSSPQVWGPLRAALAPQLGVHAPPLPGHGAPAPGGGLDRWRDALLAGLPERAVLCGWSLGALLAMAVASRAPERVAALILISATPCFVRRPDWTCGLDDDAVADFQRDFAADPTALQNRFRALQGLGDRHRREVIQALRSHAPPADADRDGMADGLAILRDTDLRPSLAQITVPARVLHGAGDALMPVEAATALADALPHGRLSVFEDCGHAPHLSRPRECATLIGSFLDA